MRSQAVVPVMLGLLALAVGCGAPENQPQPSAAHRTFAVTFQVMNNPFFPDLNQGILEVVEARGDKLITLDAQWNSMKQMNDISDMIQQPVDGLFINPVNWEGIEGSLRRAKDRGIPCIIVDAPASNADLALSTVASDNVKAGRLAAEALFQVRPRAKIVILHHSVNKACIDRVAGFREVLASHPEATILDVQEGKGTTEGSLPVMRDLLGRHPELDAVFAINDPSALGAISAIQSAGKLPQVTIVTVDGSQEGIAAIQAGKLHSTSAQFPREIGRIAAETMYAHLDGKPVDKEVAVRVELITKENAAAVAK